MAVRKAKRGYKAAMVKGSGRTSLITWDRLVGDLKATDTWRLLANKMLVKACS